jgi:hypothetical protein
MSENSQLAREAVTHLQPCVRFDHTRVKSTWRDVRNATSTCEEVVINFSINQIWDTGEPDLIVRLQQRIILSPIVAGRLQERLTRLMRDDEARHGPLNAT